MKKLPPLSNGASPYRPLQGAPLPPLAINFIAKYMYFDYLEGPGDQQDRVLLAFPESLLSLGVLKVRDTIKTF